MDGIRYPVEDFQHDKDKLQNKSVHAHGRKYTLKGPEKQAAPSKRVHQVLPASVDLRKEGYCPAALDQGQLGACASNAMSNNLCFLLGKQGRLRFQPSRLALYYNCRVNVEKEPADQDTGVSIGDLCTGTAACSGRRNGGECPQKAQHSHPATSPAGPHGLPAASTSPPPFRGMRGRSLHAC